MEQHRLDRINELSRLSRERELTSEEQAERAQLRSDYLAAFRGNFRKQLEQTVVEYPDGTQVPLTRVNDKRR